MPGPIAQLAHYNNPVTASGRNYWHSVREQQRRHARTAIRERVWFPAPALLLSTAICTREWIQKVLLQIVSNNRCFFSVPFLNAHAAKLVVPIPVENLFQPNQQQLLLGHEQITSWLGYDGVKDFVTFVQKRHTITFMEYAVWLGKMRIIGCLVLGGVNPCAGTNLQELRDYGLVVLQHFFQGVPLPLSSYIVRRVLDLRRIFHQFGGCSQCRQTDCLFQLGCTHLFCELCLWKDLVNCLHDREDDVDVVLCPVCHQSRKPMDNQEADPTMDAASRCQKSLAKYTALPKDAKSLKENGEKRRKSKVCDSQFLCSSWSLAVVPSLGLTQDVRRDKFWVHVERGSFHFVKGCLDQGVDVTLKNEYGQTALYIAAWRGDAQLTQLLLEYGCDPNETANGGRSILGVAKAKGHLDVVDLLITSGAIDASSRIFTDEAAATEKLTPTALIDATVYHPGAGSFLIDNAVSGQIVDDLWNLWRSLPIEKCDKIKKKGPCNDRCYFCDAEGELGALLRESIASAFATENSGRSHVVVLNQMRFLCYFESGAVLAPHTDLCRIDPMTNERSTHTFILYLSDCEHGGETNLLRGLESDEVLASVKPKRSRLLLFPHLCPHEGSKVEDVPKLLLRGEIVLRTG
jgi:hypothetical protein